MVSSNKPANIYSSVKKEIQVFSNISSILEKIDNDGNFSCLSEVFAQIFNTEVLYAVQGMLKRTEETQRRVA